MQHSHNFKAQLNHFHYHKQLRCISLFNTHIKQSVKYHNARMHNIQLCQIHKQMANVS